MREESGQAGRLIGLQQPVHQKGVIIKLAVNSGLTVPMAVE